MTRRMTLRYLLYSLLVVFRCDGVGLFGFVDGQEKQMIFHTPIV